MRPSALVTFSHLRWNFVYQRPQHLLSRLSNWRKVYFIEEPVLNEKAEAHLEISHPEAKVTVLRPNTPIRQSGFHEEQIRVVRQLLREYFAQEQLGPHAVWFYTPMALPLAQDLRPEAVIYDCMDELSAFLNAPAELLRREAELFQFADVVFTGGPSLYRAKKDKHPNVHCFASSVDAKHFGEIPAGAEEPLDQAQLPQPRLGYYGVIDERIDLQILDTLARSHPEWQIVMVGPVVKIDPGTLPRHSNLHYLGQKHYSELPLYLKGWDVCLQPFAQNAATKFISPTKTLEYMAASKLIVSTPITDVAEPYGHVVYLASKPEEFVRSCESALAARGHERQQRLDESMRILSRTSWDKTARDMNELVESAVAEKQSGAPAVRKPQHANESPVVVIGAGPTGLSAAYHLGERAVLIEQNDRVGGWCRSIEDHGFTFDYAGHIMFSADPYVHQMYQMLLGDNVHWQDREAWIYSKNVFTRYPFQGSLYGLPAEVIKECVIGAIEARYGSLKPAKANGNTNGGNGGSNGHASSGTNGAAHTGSNGHATAGPVHVSGNGSGVAKPACSKDASITDCCADGVLESSAPLGKQEPRQSDSEPRNFEEFIYKVWGAGIAKHFAIPYNRKLWAVPLTEMETSWLGGRVPLPDLGEMIEGALKPAPKPMGPNARFGYPVRGGFQALMNGFLPHLKGPLYLNSSVESISPERRTVRLSGGREFRYEHVVSTMPLPQLIRAMGKSVPKHVLDAVASLEHVSVRCVNIGVGREKLSDKHWIYYPEDTVFHRIFVQGNASPHCNPPGGFGLTCEITYSAHKPLPCEGEELERRCVEECRKVGIIGVDDPIWTTNQVDMPYAYVVYNHARKEAVETIREWLSRNGIHLAGRYSEWEYYNSDHAFIAGKRVAEKIRKLDEAAQSGRPLMTEVVRNPDLLKSK